MKISESNKRALQILKLVTEQQEEIERLTAVAETGAVVLENARLLSGVSSDPLSQTPARSDETKALLEIRKLASGDLHPSFALSKIFDVATRASRGEYRPAQSDDVRRQTIEECAKIAEPWPGYTLDKNSADIDYAIVEIREDIAKAIRALQPQPNEGKPIPLDKGKGGSEKTQFTKHKSTQNI